jgi:hypothetical protein
MERDILGKRRRKAAASTYASSSATARVADFGAVPVLQVSVAG